jgi:hypothetical protein
MRILRPCSKALTENEPVSIPFGIRQGAEVPPLQTFLSSRLKRRLNLPIFHLYNICKDAGAVVFLKYSKCLSSLTVVVEPDDLSVVITGDNLVVQLTIAGSRE